MALGIISFVALFFASCVAGITGTVGDFSEHVADGLADVAHMHQFELAILSHHPEWYRYGMQLFAFYVHNGYRWERKALTWDIVRHSHSLKPSRVIDTATIVFRKWSFQTQFTFRRARPGQHIDIKITFETPSDYVITDVRTIFPTDIHILDHDGVTIVFNDFLGWDHEPGTKDWLSFDYALLREVTRSLGAGENLVEGSIMHRSRDALKYRGNLILPGYDAKVIQNLYGWDSDSDSSEEPIKPPVLPTLRRSQH